MKETRNGDDGNSMVGHELARITIPIVEDLDIINARQGKALSDYKDMNQNAFILLETDENTNEGSGTTDKTSKSEKFDNDNDSTKVSGSYSYLDINGDMKTTKEISDVVLFGFKTLSLKTPVNRLAVPVASKICDNENKLSSSNTKKRTDNSPGNNFDK